MNYGKGVQERVAGARFGGEAVEETARYEATNPVCGDVVRFSLRTEGGLIKEIRWKAAGCPPALACADLLAELAEGRGLDEMVDVLPEDLIGRLDSFPRTSSHAAQVAVEALRGAIEIARRSS